MATMKADAKLSQFRMWLNTGQVDHLLDAFVDAVDQRKKVVKRIRAAAFAPGQRVRLTAAVRPRYLVGATGVVEGVNEASVSVRFDAPTKRYGAKCRVPANLVEAIPGAEPVNSRDRGIRVREEE